MKSKTAKKLAGATIAIMFIIIAGIIYNNLGHSIYIKASQIKSMSQDQCMFSFERSQNKSVHVIIDSPATQQTKRMLDVTNNDSVVFIKSSKGQLETGEVLAEVWVDGAQVSCRPDSNTPSKQTFLTPQKKPAI